MAATNYCQQHTANDFATNMSDIKGSRTRVLWINNGIHVCVCVCVVMKGNNFKAIHTPQLYCNCVASDVASIVAKFFAINVANLRQSPR